MEQEIKKSSNPLKEFFSNLHLDVLTKEKTLEILNAFQDFVINSKFIDEEKISLQLAHKIKKRKKFDFSATDFTHIYTRIVFPEDLNPHGVLFGGKLLAWIDTAGALACSSDLKYVAPVTVEMQDVYFLSSPKAGEVIKIYYQVLEEKRTSVWLRVIALNISQNNSLAIDTEVRFVDKIKLAR
jgi:acyl-CoA hydrolase